MFALCACDEVIRAIELHYTTEKSADFRQLFDNLAQLSVSGKTENSLCISVTAYKETAEDEYAQRDDFDETDASLSFDVSAYSSNDNVTYSIASSPYAEFIGYNIADKTIGSFSPSSIWRIACGN